MNFLQFFVWGAWLLTIGAYWFQNKQWSGTNFGLVFSTMGFASLFMPALMGVVADKWINAEKLYGALHICGAVMLFCIPMVDDPIVMIAVMMLTMMCYMPTIALARSEEHTSELKSLMHISYAVFGLTKKKK